MHSIDDNISLAASTFLNSTQAKVSKGFQVQVISSYL